MIILTIILIITILTIMIIIIIILIILTNTRGKALCATRRRAETGMEQTNSYHKIQVISDPTLGKS